MSHEPQSEKALSPARRRACVDFVVAEHGVSERFACRVLGQHRSTQRNCGVVVEDGAALTAAIVALALQYGRYGYRRVTAMLRHDGWMVNVKRVERIWRREGLKVPARQPKRARLWLNDGSCVRLRPERPDHVWSYDFVEHRTHNGRKYRMLNVIDEFTRECLAIRVSRKLKGLDVIDVLSDLFSLRGVPRHMRKGFSSLGIIVQETLKRDPHSGHLFVFRGRRGDLIKVIWHDGQGACLYTKRLDRGRFLWPSAADGAVTISTAQLGYLLSGIDWRMPQKSWRPSADRMRITRYKG